MTRRLRDSALDSREGRRKLPSRGVPYFRAIGEATQIGYRKLGRGQAGTWLIRSRSAGRYHHERLATADDLQDADGVSVLTFWQAVEAIRKRLTDGHSAPSPAKGITVADAMAAYLAFLKNEGRSAHSIRDTNYRINAFVLPTLGKAKANNLTVNDLREWRDSLVRHAPRLRTKAGQRQKHRAIIDDNARRARRASVNRTWTVLRAGLNHAFHADKIASDKAWRKVKPYRAVDSARVRYLSVAEAQRLINACDVEFRPLVHAALSTGARYGELIRLVVSDFNPDVGTLSIRTSKSGKPRHIVLTDEGQTFFRDLTLGRSGDEIMLRKANGSVWAMSHQLRPMMEAVGRAKIKPGISFHGLRHTWASLAVMNGVPLLVVARNLGHTDTRMVEKHYGHLAQSFIADAIRAGAPTFGFKPDRKTVALRGRA